MHLPTDALWLVLLRGLQLYHPLKNKINLPNVEFIGIKDSQEISRYYNKVRFAIFPSKYENFPLVGLEAMACGAIVITNEINGSC